MMDGGDALRSDLAGLADVSRETQERLVSYVELLKRWQQVKNLVSTATLENIWGRHILDSAQLVPLVQGEIEERDRRGGCFHWVDLGTGAGLPGLVVAILLQDRADVAKIHLVEANQRKGAFLRAAARELGLSVHIHVERIETLHQSHPGAFDFVTARALADLRALLGLSLPLLNAAGRCLFHKGRDFRAELVDAGRVFEMTVVEKQSITAEDSRLLLISNLSLASAVGK